MKTIDNVSKFNSKRNLNIDYLTSKLVTNNKYFIAPAPTYEVIEKNIYVLLKDSIVKDLDKKYYMKPHYLSYDEYGTTIFDYLLMYINGVQSMEDFIIDKVIIPSLDSIISISTSSLRNKTNMESVQW